MSTLAKKLCQIASSKVQLRSRIHLRRSFICSIFILVGMLSPAIQAQNITVNGTGSYSSIAAAFASPSPCVSGNCEVEIPAGTWTMSSTIPITQSDITVKCMGDGWWDYIGSTKGPTTISWTGGASPMFTIGSSTQEVVGFTMRGCNFDNTTTATEALQITRGFFIHFDRITISEPQKAFSTDAISCHTDTNSDPNATIDILNSLLLDAAPIEVDCDRVNSLTIDHTNLRTCTATKTGCSSSSPAAVRVGNTVGSYNFNFTNSDCEADNSASTQACLDLERVEGSSITGSYFEMNESGSTSGQLAILISGDTDDGIHIAGNRFACDSANYAIQTSGGTGMVIEGNAFYKCGSGGTGGGVNFQPTNASTVVMHGNVSDTSGTNGINFSGTTSSIGGSALTAGNCSSGTVTVAGAAPGMPVTVSTSNGTFLGGSFNLQASVTSANTVTVNVCAVVAGTPTAETYVVNVN